MLDDIHRTHRHVLRYLQSMFGTCIIGQTTSYLEQTIAWKDGTAAFRDIYVIHQNVLNVLREEEGLGRVSIFQHLGGHPPQPARRRYLDCNRRILRIVDDFPNRQRMNYLRSIAHNLSF